MNKRSIQGSARTPCLYKNEVAPEEWKSADANYY